MWRTARAMRLAGPLLSLAALLLALDLFVALLTHASELPRPILQEINRLAAKTDWPLKDIFRSVERGLARTAFSGAIGQQLAAMLDTSEDALGPLFAPVAEDEDELVPAARPRALDVDALAAMLDTLRSLDQGLAETIAADR